MKEQVLTLILKEGSPTGIIECSIDEWFGISYKIPRNKVKEIANLKAITNTGVYILLGNDVDTAEKIAYIGETENIYERLREHNRTMDFWNECIVFMSENNSLNKAHIKYIEHELHRMATEAKRVCVENSLIPTKSSLGTADEIRAKKYIEKVKMIAAMLGYRIFDSVVKNKIESDHILHLKINGIDYARGILTDEGFVILKGSKIKDGISEGISKSLINYCERERNSKDIVDGIFINDHLCSSPSMAGVIILGRNSNGYTEWKDIDGQSLRNIMKR